jgi:thiol-disulfide isomerase/thioredoxin
MEGAARRLTLLGKEMQIEGTTIGGDPFDWAAYRGKVVLVDFWTTWCPYCWPEIANAKKNYRLYHDRGFDVVGINLEEDTEKVKAYMEKEKLPWTVLHTKGAGWSHPMAIYYGVRGVPTMMLLDREGKVVSLRPRGSELDKLLKTLIGPPDAPISELVYIDIRSKGNAKLADDLSDSEGNNLAELPRGEQTFGDVKFRIDDSLIQLAGKQLPERPEKVQGIPVNRKFERLYILHGTGWAPPDGTVIGQYVVHYEDDTTATIPIVYGEDVRNWWNGDDSSAVTRGKVVWTGSNPAAKQYDLALRLYLAVWENPQPDKQVTSIDYVSTNTTDAAPFCVAITAKEAAGR